VAACCSVVGRPTIVSCCVCQHRNKASRSHAQCSALIDSAAVSTWLSAVTQEVIVGDGRGVWRHSSIIAMNHATWLNTGVKAVIQRMLKYGTKCHKIFGNFILEEAKTLHNKSYKTFKTIRKLITYDLLQCYAYMHLLNCCEIAKAAILLTHLSPTFITFRD